MLRSLGAALILSLAAQPAATQNDSVSERAPSSEEQAKIIGGIREKAMNYIESLPDYMCSQLTRRYIDPTGHEAWRPRDVILARLTYFEKHEDYKLISINDTAVSGRAYNSLGGAISRGEFGSMLRGVFDPHTNTRFRWESWTTHRGHLSYVFSYTVPLEHSQYTIQYQGTRTDKGITIHAGYHGSITADKATSRVLRITLEADGLPKNFPVRHASQVLDYDFVKIGDAEYLLPLTSEFRSFARHRSSRNLVEFRNYRKFSADAKISFEDGSPQN